MVPVQYQVLEQTPAQWSQLHRAVDARAVATRLNQTVPDKVQTLLTSVDAQPEVVAAAANLAQHKDEVSQAWKAALSQ
jgi:hypothetical protein